MPKKSSIPVCKFHKKTPGSKEKSATIDCNEEGKKCLTCGWNPEVERERKKRIYAERGLIYAD